MAARRRRYPTAKVTVAGEVQALLPLDHEGRHELVVSGERMVIEVGHGRVRVVESTCPDQICVGTGWIAHTKEAIACVPAQVLITVIGGSPRSWSTMRSFTEVASVS